MTKRRWTVILVPQGSRASRIFEFSGTAVALVATLGVAGLLVAGLLGYGTIARTIDMTRARRIEAENVRLAAELGQIQARMGALSDTVATLEKHDTQFRLLANLDPIDPQVHAVGIGGPRPEGESTETAGVLAENAGRVRIDLDAMIRRANLRARSFREAGDSLAAHTERLAATPSIMPTQGWLTSAFARAREHPILHFARPHEGLDITAPAGSPIEATANGKVTFAGWETGYGNMIVIDHGFGIITKFAHASKLLVKVGAVVRRGEAIALVGNTGLSTGPHLHYEVHVNGHPVDPKRFVLPDVVTD
jgi:murein DD-endopeptidase MepM/ murein hydrolase activator NlpD